MKHLAILFVAIAVLVSDASFACGPHGGCGGVGVSVNVNVGYRGYGGGYGGYRGGYG